VTNAGRIEADGGTLLLTAQASAAVLPSVINQSDAIQARRLEQVGGEIVLPGGEEGAVMVAGALDAYGIGETRKRCQEPFLPEPCESFSNGKRFLTTKGRHKDGFPPAWK
jgi:hypothetical protein